VQDVARDDGAFRLATSQGVVTSRSLVLATGGLSLPKTGSDGWGYGIAQRLGHALVPTTPALVPLMIPGDDASAIHRDLSGVSLRVRLDVRVDGKVAARIPGSLLWTHFGISGPATLDASRHWLRARLDGRQVALSASLCPSESFESLEHAWTTSARTRPRTSLQTLVAALLPASAATAVLDRVAIRATQTLAELTREARRTLIQTLLEWPLPISDSRGYNYAEVTAGGVMLPEIDPSSMSSRTCPGLTLVGEILDVDGRIGGFNFQWAWSTARVAGEALAALYSSRVPAP
jgi:predicted Rossmann fold flavoprotein